MPRQKKRSRGALKLPPIYKETLQDQIRVIELGKHLSSGDVARETGLNHQSCKRLIEEGVPFAHEAPVHTCKFCLASIATNYCLACYISKGLLDEYKTD